MKSYITILKPRLSLLVLVTAYLGFYLGIRSQGEYVFSYDELYLLFYLLFGIFLSSSGSIVLNQVIEKDHDAKMQRTKNRPIPTGKISSLVATIYGFSLIVSGIVLLLFKTNAITALLSFLTVISYLLIYTPMKRFSTLNTLIGSVPGAIPPMGGWTAATGSLSEGSWVLFGILFCWQMPHFMAIAILYAKDYKQGGFKMLPSEYPGSKHTNYHILFFTIALLGTSIGLFALKLVGIFYIVGAAIIGMLFLSVALKVFYNINDNNARQLLYASFIYLPILLLLIILDKSF
jgi:protoheme IX farnesyltransferase|tara:strand:- start:815 stop:1684 length:870 start_codon:yes stop_codon:yes gene_type:complete